MYSIGEFSRISGLSIKALHLYHEKGILVPSVVDRESGYRYYDHKNADKARIIRHLRDLEFSLNEIGEILNEGGDEAEVMEFFEKKREEIEAKIRRQQGIVRNLEQIIQSEKEAKMIGTRTSFEIQEKVVDPHLAAGIRFKGRYCDCGKAFGKIGKGMGWNLSGKPFNLYYDDEYKEADADIESCMPIKKVKQVPGLTVREFPGGKCVALVHQGSYDTLGRSYEKVMAYIKQKGYRVRLPIRELYLKGPGMIFRGKPEKYLTEIQIFIDVPS